MLEKTKGIILHQINIPTQVLFHISIQGNSADNPF